MFTFVNTNTIFSSQPRKYFSQGLNLGKFKNFLVDLDCV
jgi:hypothetical protein